MPYPVRLMIHTCVYVAQNYMICDCYGIYECAVITIWDSSRENDNSHLYIKCYINASRLNRYIFRTVNAINILFSTLHTTPFLYGKILFGVLHLLLASIATFDTPRGSNPP